MIRNSPAADRLLVRITSCYELVAGVLVSVMMLAASPVQAADNQLTPQEHKDGWLLLFDGSTLSGWMTSSQKPSRRPIEDHAINPHKCGSYMVIHERQWDNFVLSLGFASARAATVGSSCEPIPLLFGRGGTSVTTASRCKSWTVPPQASMIRGPSTIW